MPCRIPARAPARNRSVRSSSRRWERTSSSCASVRGWNASATSGGTGSVRASGRRRCRRPARAVLAGSALTRSASASQPAGVGGPGEAERGEPGAGLGGRGGLELGGGQDVGERVEVVADADTALRGRLDGRRAAAAERVQDHVAGTAVAGDEPVGEGRREAREVRAHRVEAVAPQPWLRLPLGLDPEGGQRAGQLEGELAGRDGSRRDGRSGIPGLRLTRGLGPPARGPGA